MKKIVTAVIIVLLLGVGGFLGYGMYSADANSVPEGHFGEVQYVEMSKSEIQSYVNEFIEIVNETMSLNEVSYNLGVESADGVKSEEIDEATEYVEGYGSLYEYIVDYHKTTYVPLQMKETHETILEAVYYTELAATGFSEGFENDDLSKVKEWMKKSGETMERAIDENPHIFRRKHSPGLDYLTNQ